MAQINSVLDTMTYVLGDKGNHIKNLTVAGKGRAVDDKFYTELIVFDKKTFNQMHPYISGRFIFVVGEMPRNMEILYPKETAYMKVLMSTSIMSISGFAAETLETDEVKAPTDQNTTDYVTRLAGRTNQIELQFTCEYTSLVITNYITTWMHSIYQPGSSASSYAHLTGLEYHEGNHSMTAVYVVTNPSFQTVEMGAVFYGMVPLGNAQDSVLNNTRGDHNFHVISIPFKVHTYTTSLANVMEICKKTLDDYVNRTAVVDYRIKKKPSTTDFLL